MLNAGDLNARPTDLSIVIVNWNSGGQLGVCIESIARAAQRGECSLDVIVVDNASSDDSVTGIEQASIPVRFIRNSSNRGFGAACNQGAAIADAEFILFLNPDTQLMEGSLALPLAFMNSQAGSKFGICGIRLVDNEGRATVSAARFPTAAIILSKALLLPSILPGVFDSHFMSASELQRSTEVDQVIGAFMLMRRWVFEKCRGFDESFFMYFEEVDLSLRARELGHPAYYLSEAVAFHIGGGCSSSVKAARLSYSLDSRSTYAKKHFGILGRAAVAMATWIELPARLVRALMTRSWTDIRDTLRAYGLFAIRNRKSPHGNH
jgi:N-acetylglucosaminyl-diphospho-decaprenol L-rhamnosyltransferase